MSPCPTTAWGRARQVLCTCCFFQAGHSPLRMELSPGALFFSPATHSPVTPEGWGSLGQQAGLSGWEGGSQNRAGWGTLPAAFGLGSWGLKLKLKAKVQPQREQPPSLLEFAFLPFWCQALRAHRGKAFWKLLEPLQNTLDNKMGWSRALGAGPPHQAAIASWLTLTGLPKTNLGEGAKQGWEGDTNPDGHTYRRTRPSDAMAFESSVTAHGTGAQRHSFPAFPPTSPPDCGLIR